MLALQEGALVEQWDATALVGELVELAQESLPGDEVGGGRESDRSKKSPLRAYCTEAAWTLDRMELR